MSNYRTKKCSRCGEIIEGEVFESIYDDDILCESCHLKDVKEWEEDMLDSMYPEGTPDFFAEEIFND